MAAPERDRGKGRQIRKARLYHADPRCAHCRRPVLMDECAMDHIVALINGGRDHDGNCQILCHPCHDAKTREDMRQARGGVGSKV